MTTTVPGLSKDTATTGRLQRLLRRPLALEWRSRRCPRCGRGRLFCAFLKVDDHCSVCRLDFTGHRADDLPAYLLLAIVIVGHVLVPVILWMEVDYAPSLAFQLGIYLPISALASISLLQPVKGAVVALQWSLKMHGFGVHPPDELQALRRKVPQRNGADVRRYDAADEIAGARARFSCAVPLRHVPPQAWSSSGGCMPKPCILSDHCSATTAPLTGCRRDIEAKAEIGR